ncbi:nuclear pore complex protein NUP160 isoform X2 [Telopea speciosissima]|uniref:nuclear pore complex protein NUP160 isoform X2 n=1 Tax=Telopea speciosissima TaxID=54955 RepID=UPI001CC498D2|nr:nuclear pore complex protein NUP160 isoform X2 [Telopea speciosissima]
MFLHMESRLLAGMEVPLIGSNDVKWIEVSVPSSYLPAATAVVSSSQPCAPLTKDAASCHIIGDSSQYIIWRIHENLPHVVELIEISACKEFPRIGLRLSFPHALSPFAFICKNEAKSTVGNSYLLYALEVSGVAYILKLRNICTYVSCSLFPRSELVEVNVQTDPQVGAVTAVAATVGCLVLGRQDGSISCFRLGAFDQTPLDLMHELRDDVGIGRFWGLMARVKSTGAVLDLVISEVHGRKLLFVLHADGSLRVWDLLSHVRLLSHTITIPTMTGVSATKLRVGDADNTSLISLAILYSTMELDANLVATLNLSFTLGEKINLSLEPSITTIPLEGRIIDFVISCKKLWILKDDGLMLYNMFCTSDSKVEAFSYGLQDTFVADQLFQDVEHSADDLIWFSHSLISALKDQVVPFVSSIFLRRLLYPGVHQSVVLRETMQEYNKHWTDSEFQSLTVDDLKKEILYLIESEAVAEYPMSVIYCWKKLCTRYFHYWCKNSRPYGFLVDSSTGAVGLIRKNSISMFRCLEDIELLINVSDEHSDFVTSGLDLPDDDLDREVLFEVLRLASSIRQQLGKAAVAIFYESLVSTSTISSEEIVAFLLKVLETGYSASMKAAHRSQLGINRSWGKKLSDHKNQRQFSIDMLLSLHALCNKATSGGKVLDVIENYLKFLVPRKTMDRLDSKAAFSVNTSMLVQATSQVANVMFESAFDILLLLGYLVNTNGQVLMSNSDISRIQLELIPMINETLAEWLILYFLGTTPSESPALEDFSSRLSSLHIGSHNDTNSWNEMLGTCDFTLACILIPNFSSSFEEHGYISSRYFTSPEKIISSMRNFCSWIIWGRTGEQKTSMFSRISELAVVLLRHGQCEAVENLLAIIEAHSRKETISQSVQTADGEWCMHLHLLGCCLLARAQFGLQESSKQRKIHEAVRCFFRASCGQGAYRALRSLSLQTGFHPGFSCDSAAAWKLHYYQWAMQTFEHYNLSEGACQFAFAALEQVDEALRLGNDTSEDNLSEPATAIRGRLWANIFKFTLDLNNYHDAYCAIISNPDEDSKYVCLRRLIIVLCERFACKTLCDGQLPFIGLAEKVRQELVWKAERSDSAANPNPYKLLYAFEMHRNNFRRAASYIHRYSDRVRSEATLKAHQQIPMALQERLNGLSAAINALHLVHIAYSWIDPQIEDYSCLDEHHPSKRPRKFVDESSMDSNGFQAQGLQYYIDIEKMEKEFLLTSAQYLLCHANMKSTFTGNQVLPSDVVDMLVQTDLYDMAFTVLLKFRKGSGLKRELERVFVAISKKCCPNGVGSPYKGNDIRTHGLLLASSEDETFTHSPFVSSHSTHQLSVNCQWEALEVYLEKYKKLHPRLPVIVAETLLQTDPQIELPLWLVHMFKGGRKATCWGMTGQEADPASLFRLYVDYARYAEATNLVLEFIESLAFLRPADIIKRKKISAVWFPYTAVERLWCHLEELSNAGQMMNDQCDTLKKLLHGALLNHLTLMKVDSRDALSSAFS